MGIGYPDCWSCYGRGGKWDSEAVDQWYPCDACAERDDREPEPATCGPVGVDANGAPVELEL